jgi:hypothetical protein
MNQIKTHLATLVQSISDDVERIQQYKDKIPQIEIDILLESIREFYTNVLELNKVNIGMDNSNSHIVINTLQEAQDKQAETSPVADDTEEQASQEEPATSIEEPQATIEKVEEVLFEEPVAEEKNNDNSEEAFESMVENETMLQDIANDDDILSPKSIIEFESVEYEQPAEEVVAPIAAVEEEEPKVDEVVSDVSTIDIDEKTNTTETEGDTIIVEDTPEPTPTKDVKQPTAEPESVTEPKTQPQKNEEHEEPRQISLFDYLKSSNVSRAAEQVDRFSGVTVKTLADKFQESKEKEKILFESAHEREPQKRRIEDLRTIIGINDKILFMTDLFDRNMKAYNDFILQLNKIDDTNTALEYLKTMEETYKWDKESLAVQSFIKIFERKFK